LLVLDPALVTLDSHNLALDLRDIAAARRFPGPPMGLPAGGIPPATTGAS